MCLSSTDVGATRRQQQKDLVSGRFGRFVFLCGGGGGFFSAAGLFHQSARLQYSASLSCWYCLQREKLASYTRRKTPRGCRSAKIEIGYKVWNHRVKLRTANMSGANERGDTGAHQLLPRHRYMLQKVDAAFGIYDENATEAMFLQTGVIDQVRGQDQVCLP